MFKSRLTVVYLGLCLAWISVCVLGQLPEDDELVACAAYSGCFKGTYMEGFQSQQFLAFMGIPYAIPPLGDLRFGSPRRAGRNPDTVDATKPKPDCIRKEYLSAQPVIYGDEDCLYLNVYRPMPLSEELLPVMVYIHGGGFIGGSAGPSVSGPEYFMDSQAVVLVTVSYRVGVLGYLSTGDENMRGNYGLKDQLLALKWVRDNIHGFGGDYDEVTLFGHGIDGVATHLHLLNRNSAGLFRKVISMSGTANVPIAINRKPLEQARKVAELCGIDNADTINTVELTDALKTVDLETLINAEDGFKYFGADPLYVFRPVIEENVQGAFLIEEPVDAIEYGHYQKVPWLLGTVETEGALRTININENPYLRDQLNSNFSNILKQLVEFPSQFNEQKKNERTELLIKQYLNEIHALGPQTIYGFLNIMTDRHFKHPLYTAVRDYVRSGENRVHMYNFNYKGPVSYASVYAKANPSRDYGVVHGDDLIYLFRSPRFFPDFSKDSKEAKLITQFVAYFVEFARNGAIHNQPALSPCSANIFGNLPDGFCQYHSFENDDGENGFKVVVKDQFHTNRVQYWLYLLE